jgi:hypothetical protein
LRGRRSRSRPGTLTEPGGIAVGKRGELYISNHGREDKVGEVLRISLG